MTDRELLDAIRRIIRTRPRLDKNDSRSAEARDLAKYDQIAGLLQRIDGSGSAPKRTGVAVTDLTGGRGQTRYVDAPPAPRPEE